MYKEFHEDKLKEIANKVRLDILKMTGAAGSGHPGGSLSAVEMIVFLYFYYLNIKPGIELKKRDFFILSKGHSCPALYSVLARKGFFKVKELLSLRKLGSFLQGHPDMNKTPGIEMSTGSLGQGISVAVGTAMASKLDRLNRKVVSMIGDGECDEGQVWEAALLAHHYKLDNLYVILDRNKLQIDGTTEDILALEQLSAKWKAFGWAVFEVDGHNFKDIKMIFKKAEKVKEQPKLILSNTIKGKGISFMENNNEFHGTAPTKEELSLAIKELTK